MTIHVAETSAPREQMCYGLNTADGVGKGHEERAIRDFDDEERAILAALDKGVPDTELAAMLHELAEILRGKGGHVAARVAEIAADQLWAVNRPG